MIFGDFGSKTRENIDFLPIYKDLQEILWSKVLLPYFEYFLSKKFLSSLEFSNYDTCTSSQAHGAVVSENRPSKVGQSWANMNIAKVIAQQAPLQWPKKIAQAKLS